MWVDAEKGVLFSHAEVKALGEGLASEVRAGLVLEGVELSGAARRRLEAIVSEYLHRLPELLAREARLGEQVVEPGFLLTPDMPTSVELLGHLRSAMRAAGTGSGDEASAAAAAFTVWQRAHTHQPGILKCPECGRRMFSADERCSGTFTSAHPANVAPVRA